MKTLRVLSEKLKEKVQFRQLPYLEKLETVQDLSAQILDMYLSEYGHNNYLGILKILVLHKNMKEYRQSSFDDVSTGSSPMGIKSFAPVLYTSGYSFNFKELHRW